MEKEKTHWLQSPNKNYLGHWDLPPVGEMTVTIESAKWEEVKNPITNKSEAKRVIRFTEKIKPMICNQTNAQSIVNATGVKFMEDSQGQKITLFVSSIKDKVSKEDVDCIRVKRVVPFTLKNIKEMVVDKQSLITDSNMDSINRAINNNDTTKFEQIFNYLNKL